MIQNHDEPCPKPVGHNDIPQTPSQESRLRVFGACGLLSLGVDHPSCAKSDTGWRKPLLESSMRLGSFCFLIFVWLASAVPNYWPLYYRYGGLARPRHQKTEWQKLFLGGDQPPPAETLDATGKTSKVLYGLWGVMGR